MVLHFGFHKIGASENIISSSPSSLPSSLPTRWPSMPPSIATSNPSLETTLTSSKPSASPTLVPSGDLSLASSTTALTSIPSAESSSHPSSEFPSFAPTSSPTALTSIPSSLPSISSRDPSSHPSSPPSESILPSSKPSTSSTPTLSSEPSSAPSASSIPSNLPSSSPSIKPSSAPSASSIPSNLPSSSPSIHPSVSLNPSSTSRPSSTPSTSVSPTIEPKERGVSKDVVKVNYGFILDAYQCSENHEPLEGPQVIYPGQMFTMCVRVDPMAVGYDFVVDKFLNVFVNQEGSEPFTAVLDSEVSNPALVIVDDCDDGICMLQTIFLARFFAEKNPPPLSVRGSVALVSESNERFLSICNDGNECNYDTMVPHLIDMEVTLSSENLSGVNVLFMVCFVAFLSSTTTFLILRVMKWSQTKRDSAKNLPVMHFRPVVYS